MKQSSGTRQKASILTSYLLSVKHTVLNNIKEKTRRSPRVHTCK
uniref:Uncharacterized protein n=1 Tax=Arundo donax TaxID=35708 RepID=A0A0A8Y4D9_ARUDO